MYALRTTDIPPRRHNDIKGGEDGAIPGGSASLDIHFEERKLDLSLRRFILKPTRPEAQNSSTNTSLDMPAAVVPTNDPPKLPTSNRQRKRLLKKNTEQSCMRTCDELSRNLRNPDKHHAHYTEDYPNPRERHVANETSIRGGEVVGQKVEQCRSLLLSSTTPISETRELPPNKPEKLKGAPNGSFPDWKEVDERPTSKIKRGLARVKSMSAILINSGSGPQSDAVCSPRKTLPQNERGVANFSIPEVQGPGRKSTERSTLQGAEQVALKQDAKNTTTTPPLPSPPAVGFITNEAMQHDRVRFANAFRSRFEVRRQQELEKATSAASLARIRGGWGGRDRGFDVPDWVREIDDQMRRMRDDPQFQPFRRVREHHGNDGSYHYQDVFDYDSRRDGPIGWAGQDGGRVRVRERMREGGRRGGGFGGRIRGLFGGGRPPSPPGGYDSDSDDGLLGGPPPRGPPGMGGHGMGMRGFGGFPPGIGPRDLGEPPDMGHPGMERFGRMPPGMGPLERGGFMGMGPPGMGGFGGMPVGMFGPIEMVPRGMGGMGGFGGIPVIVGIPVMGGGGLGGWGMFPGGGHGAVEDNGPRDGPQDLDQDGEQDGDASDDGGDPVEEPAARRAHLPSRNRRR